MTRSAVESLQTEIVQINKFGQKAMNTANAERLGKWAIVPAGIVMLVVGIGVGGFQFLVHYGCYKAGTRGVTLDRLYNIIFFWAFWIAVSGGYLASGLLIPHRPRISLVIIGSLGIMQVSVVALVLWEIGLL